MHPHRNKTRPSQNCSEKRTENQKMDVQTMQKRFSQRLELKEVGYVTDEYLEREPKLAMHKVSGRTYIGIPAANKAEIHEWFVMDGCIPAPRSLAEFGELRIGNEIHKPGKQPDQVLLRDLNWPEWEENQTVAEVQEDENRD